MTDRAEHTLGPWIADVRNENCAYLEGPPTSYSEWYFENAADARLIAAAPDLLTALERISAIQNQEYGGDWDEIEEAREIARAAIAQAKGES